MGYAIRQDIFDKTFLGKKGFQHNTNELYNLFPYNTKDQSDKILSDYNGFFGAFLQDIYSMQANEISRDSIIEEICKEVYFDNNPVNKQNFVAILKELYFDNEHSLKCTRIDTYKYINRRDKNYNKIAAYIVSTICDKERIGQELKKHSNSNRNILDRLVEDHLPKPLSNTSSKPYLSLFPKIKELFTNDFIFLIRNSNTEFLDLIQLISYYYFFYTSQVILQLNDFCRSKEEIKPVYFCVDWEKTSRHRDSFSKGWQCLDGKRVTMYAHAALLEMLNQTGCEKKYSYKDIFDEYNFASDEEKIRIYSCIENIKRNYREKYAPEEGFTYGDINYTPGDLESLLRGFFDDIALQLQKSTTRGGVDDKYQKGFYLFCKNNFLQNRRRNGLMLVLNEEQLVLFTKIIIGDKPKMRLNELFKEFALRGIGMDRQTQKCVVEFYEKLNLIEKKSDSGDAQYVKGIL